MNTQGMCLILVVCRQDRLILGTVARQEQSIAGTVLTDLGHWKPRET
jgi:hypothetical protein